MIKNGVKRNIKLTDGIMKQNPLSSMSTSDPKNSNQDQIRLKQKIISDRKQSVNRTNLGLQNQNIIQGSSSLKRNQFNNFINNGNFSSNPWNQKLYPKQYPYYPQNQQEIQPMNQNLMDESSRLYKPKIQQYLPSVKQNNFSPTKQSYQYGVLETKNEYYHQQNSHSIDKGNNESNYGINKTFNNSKTAKQILKPIINERNSSSKENLYEGMKKESHLPSIPISYDQQNIQDINPVKPTDHISSTTQQSKGLFQTHDKSDKLYEHTLLDSQKENLNKAGDFVTQNKFISKNNTLSMNPKSAFVTIPQSNNIKVKDNNDKTRNQKDSQIKSALAQTNNNVNDHLEDKLDKIYESLKSAQPITKEQNYLPPKMPYKEQEKQIETKEKEFKKIEMNISSELPSLKNKIQEGEPTTSRAEKQQNESGLERKASFQIKVKNELSINPLVSYFKHDFDFAKYHFEFSKRSAAGLNNIGNTCFMNSAIQCVFNTPVFNEFFFSNMYEKDINPKNKGVAQSYSALIKQVRSTGSSSSSQAPYSLKKSIERVSSQFYGTDQQDAQELLRTLLDGLHEDLNRVRTKPKYRELEADINKRNLQEISDDWYNYYKGRDDSLVTDFFSGQLVSKVICSKCNNKSLAFDNFMDLSLSFSKGQENEADLVDLLKTFLKEENLDDDYYCSKCKARTKSRRQFELYKLPQILVIHLKRFNFGRYNRNKISSSVSFPVTNFDLSQFMSTSNDPSTKNSKYELFGIVNHSGSLSGGHYTSESLNPYDGKWYNFNDSHAGQISKESINKYSTSGRSSPYLLFYCKSELLIPYSNSSSYEHSRMKSNL